MVTQSLGDRMREYMDIPNIRLIKRMPVIIFVDGWHFHTLTRGMKKPFDQTLIDSMWDAAKLLCDKIEGAKLAYIQSDEISVLVTNYETLNQGAFFDYRVEKLCSIAASIATIGFNSSGNIENGMFDARCFNLNPDEVCNWFIYRQQDWVRNSVQMLAQSMFSQKELNGKCQSELHEMMFENGTNWNDLPGYLKNGTCITKTCGGFWEAGDAPIFKSDRYYINRFVFPSGIES